jgi:hypothetical protein
VDTPLLGLRKLIFSHFIRYCNNFFQKTSRSLRGFGAKLANPRPSFNTQNGQNENNPVKAADAKRFTN